MRVLLCDDHPIATIANAMLMEAHGHEVVATTYHPDQVRALVEAHRPDRVVIDLLYGETRDCVAALVAIRDIAAECTVVVLSGSADPIQRQAAIAAGATEVVSKAMPSEQVVALIEGRECAQRYVRPAPVENTHRLTAREQEVLQCLANGLSTPGIAASLDMRGATARSHVRSLMLKLGVHSRAAAVARAVNEGLVLTA